MSAENLVLIYASLGLVITTCLITLNNIRVDAEKRMNEPIDFIAYVNQKAHGDRIDKLIAEYLNESDFAA